MNILAIGAHPDDIEIGCVGTLLALKKKHSANILMLVFTGCGTRLAEQKVAGDILNMKYHILDFLDTEIPLKPSIIQIENYIEKWQPDYIFTHYADDTHQDHRTVAEATVSACRNSNNILFYPSLSTENFAPNLLVDIGKHFDNKCQALGSHKSQACKELTEHVEILSRFHAHRTGLKRVEAFVSRKFLWKL